MGEVLHRSLLQLLLQHCDFLNIDISQGSVAARLRCGGIFRYELVANLPVSQTVKEFWKSVNIWGSYGQEFGVLFFSETQCILCDGPVLVHPSVWSGADGPRDAKSCRGTRVATSSRECKPGGLFKTPCLWVWRPPNPSSRVPGFNYVSPAAGQCWR